MLFGEQPCQPSRVKIIELSSRKGKIFPGGSYFNILPGKNVEERERERESCEEYNSFEKYEKTIMNFHKLE